MMLQYSYLLFLWNAAKSGLQFAIRDLFFFRFHRLLLLKFLPSFNKLWSTQLNTSEIRQRGNKISQFKDDIS